MLYKHLNQVLQLSFSIFSKQFWKHFAVKLKKQKQTIEVLTFLFFLALFGAAGKSSSLKKYKFLKCIQGKQIRD